MEPSMKSVIITRNQTTDEGTFGTLKTVDGKLTLHTLELPWRDVNKDGIGDPQKSCITPGTYRAIWHESPSKGWCYWLQDVKGRSHILIHSANYAGDVDKGWQSQLLGCIAPALSVGKMANNKGKQQMAGLNSRAACKALFDWANKEDLLVTIK